MHACVYPGDTRKFALNFAEMQDGTTYLDLPLHDRTHGHAWVGEFACWRNSRGERYFKALCGCDSL